MNDLWHEKESTCVLCTLLPAAVSKLFSATNAVQGHYLIFCSDEKALHSQIILHTVSLGF